MKKWVIWSSVIGLVLLSFAIFLLVERCPSSCDDGSNCTVDRCSKETGYECQNEIIEDCDGNNICEFGEFGASADCPDCDDGNVCSEDIYNYENHRCYHYNFTPCNGNRICEDGEYGNSTDCPDCDDDNDCTNDTVDYESGECVHQVIFPCCGNDVCEASENFMDCQSDCMPTLPQVNVHCGADDDCRLEYVEKINDVSLCFYMATVEMANECIIRIALHNRNYSICKNSMKSEDYDEIYGAWAGTEFGLENVIDDCEQEVIVKYFPYRFCRTKLVFPNICIEEVALRDNNVSICEFMIEERGFTNTQESFVEKCKAVVTRDWSRCKFIEKNFLADDCLEELAVMLNDTMLCGEHSSPGACELKVLGD